MTNTYIRPFSPSDAQWVIDQHDVRYTRDEGFDATFGVLVKDIVTDFSTCHDPIRERGWIAERDGQRLGCIFCMRLNDQTAKLRIFFLLPAARGAGLGRRLLTTCMGFAKSAGYTRMQLWTHESHRAACALYAKTGWTLRDSKRVHSFGVDLVEQSWQITL